MDYNLQMKHKKATSAWRKKQGEQAQRRKNGCLSINTI